MWRNTDQSLRHLFLKKAQSLAVKIGFLICWNSGLGDIPLGSMRSLRGFVSLFLMLKIAFITRYDLADGFKILTGVAVAVDPDMEARPFLSI